MIKSINELRDILKENPKARFTIRVLSLHFMGALSNEPETYENYGVETFSGNEVVELSAVDDDVENYEDISDESLIVINQSDLDNGYVTITKED